MPVLIVLLALPLVEIALFVMVGSRIGVGATLALVLAAAVLGVVVIRSTGTAAARLRGVPGAGLLAAAMPVADAALRMLAGGLLVLPGFLSDAVALALLVPPVRRALIAAVAARVVLRGGGIGGGIGGGGARPADRVIDGTFIEIDPEPRGPGGGRRTVPPDAPGGWTRH